MLLHNHQPFLDNATVNGSELCMFKSVLCVCVWGGGGGVGGSGGKGKERYECHGS